MEIDFTFKETLSIDQVIDFLNHLIDTDTDALGKLMAFRTPCNEKMADHPSVQVVGLPDGTNKVGILGILNGMFGHHPNHWGEIGGDFDIVCPNGHEPENDASIYKKCPECGAQLVTGNPTKFFRISKERPELLER